VGIRLTPESKRVYATNFSGLGDAAKFLRDFLGSAYRQSIAEKHAFFFYRIREKLMTNEKLDTIRAGTFYERSCKFKQTYSSPSIALEHALYFERKFRHKQKPYFCKFCGNYHLRTVNKENTVSV
jgi:hypothetical protein